MPVVDKTLPAWTRPERREAAPLSFDEVYQRHQLAVYRYCLARLADPEAARDAAATTFVKALRAYGRARPDATGVRLWLLRIAGNVVKDEVRHRRRSWRLLGALLRSVPAPPDPEERVLLGSEVEQVMDALTQLSDRDQRLVALRCGAGLAYRDVAQAMGMTENAARVATGRALGRLRQTVEGRG
ncbi:MAG: RNA polymerase sigma factor [Candidatus Dormibacteria bacterium]